MQAAAYKPKRVVVLNTSGNVGKTTISIHLLSAFRPDAKYISVENFNNSEARDVASLQIEELQASQFRDIYRQLMMEDDVIVDVGASNVEKFMEELTKYRTAINQFDMIVIPTVPDSKQQKDTIETIQWLNKLGVPGAKIRVVFNQYQGGAKLRDTYQHIIGFSLDDGAAQVAWLPHVVVEHNEIFEYVKSSGKTIRELQADTTDWGAALKDAKAAKDPVAMERAMDNRMAHDLADSAMPNLVKAYQDLFATPAETQKVAKK